MVGAHRQGDLDAEEDGSHYADGRRAGSHLDCDKEGRGHGAARAGADWVK